MFKYYRVAILLEEECSESLQEAVKYYSGDNYSTMMTCLRDLHDTLNRDPVSQNEISFLQKYKNKLNQAEAQLDLYENFRIKNCLYSAWCIYRD